MIFGRRLKAAVCCSKCACSALKPGTRKRTAWKPSPRPKRTVIPRNCRMTMRIFYTLTGWTFAAILAFGQPPAFAFQDSQRDIDRNARREQEQLRRLQDSSSESYSRGKSYLDRKEYDRAIDAFSRVIDNNARREQEQLRRLQDSSSESYSRGKSYLDRKEYDRAIDAFSRVIDNKASRADGAYYWRAYAQNKLGHRDEALASLDALEKSYPGSRWLDDAKALRVEIRSQSGQPVS